MLPILHRCGPGNIPNIVGRISGSTLEMLTTRAATGESIFVKIGPGDSDPPPRLLGKFSVLLIYLLEVSRSLWAIILLNISLRIATTWHWMSRDPFFAGQAIHLTIGQI